MTKPYAALLRGINVGGSKKLPMAQLRALLAALGHGDVRTYLQSGNAFFTSDHDDEAALAGQLRQAIAARFGFDVEVLVRDHDYLTAVVEACPFPAASLRGKQLHVTYLSERVDESRLASLDRAAFLPEEFRLGDRALYLYAPDGLGRSPFGEALARSGPSKGVVATSRNWNTVLKLVELTEP
ncbi:hypothetical protein CELL_01684 [Cellulomonas sp. T2.31MG-18]|uniref:DUF1697 domain-containing protein n=1 Tax=Cellulomonas sp. T2.31MG-18 TaxID=3157619 RepID=UPI0035E727D9